MTTRRSMPHWIVHLMTTSPVRITQSNCSNWSKLRGSHSHPDCSLHSSKHFWQISQCSSERLQSTWHTGGSLTETFWFFSSLCGISSASPSNCWKEVQLLAFPLITVTKRLDGTGSCGGGGKGRIGRPSGALVASPVAGAALGKA